MAVLELHKAEKSFGKKDVIKEASFSLKTGDILGLFGRNGSGKSTLLQLVFGTLPASEISLSLDHSPIVPASIIRNKVVGYVPQDPFLPTQSRVRDLIPLYFSEEHKQDLLFYDPIISQLTYKKGSELSMGERKYVEVMLVAHLDHPFLFLDEPFSMLEPLQIERLKIVLKGLQKEKGIIITDHYYTDVLEITTKNIVMKNGIGIEIKNVDDLIAYDYLSKP